MPVAQEFIRHYKFVAVLNLLLGLVWLVHVLACGWYLCAALWLGRW